MKSKLHNEELKDAYRGWLKDLDDEKPERVLKKLDKRKKGGGKRRSRQTQRMLHVQQPTAASSLKDVALKKEKLPVISLRHAPEDKQNLQDSQIRRHQALVAEANYSAFQYAHHPSWRPGLAFFQQLVRQLLSKAEGNEDVVSAEVGGFPVQVAPILLRVPLHRQGGKQHLSVALLFCQEQNQDEQQVVETGVGITSFVLHCRVYLQARSWREHRSSLLDMVSNSSAEICALRKCTENFESRNNELQLLRSRQEVEKVIDELWIDDYDKDLLAVQKYIPFKGASSTNTSSTERKAWIARCASRKRDKNSSTVWIISGGDNRNSFSTAITSSSSTDCQLVKCSIDQAWSEPRLLASMCTVPWEKALRVRFNELVVDLLQDTCGTWWLLQVKAFTLASLRPASAVSVSTSLSKKHSASLSRTQSAPTGFDAGIATSQWKKWRCAGRFCVMKGEISSTNQQLGEDFDDEKEPCGYLTKKMVRSCEFYDDFVQHQDMSLAGGFTEFHSALGFHLQHRLSKRDRSQLYEPQPLCSACVKKYHLLRQQWIETVDAPKASTERNLAGLRKKISYVKSISESTPRTNSGLHKLPALHAVPTPLNTSSSAPVIAFSTHSKSFNTQETASNQPNYLDELAAMEKMLAEHDLLSLSITEKAESQSPASQKSTKTSLVSLNPLLTKPGRDDIFPKWDGVTRIEEMWQNLTFKPIEKQLTENVTDSSRKNQGYNSISLKQELAKAVEMSDNNDDNDAQANHEANLHNKVHQGIDRKESDTAHRVHVQHCRRVFEDEIYREGLVNDTLSAFRSGKASVCFVVTRKRTDREDDELAEMALHSLYLDVKQAIASSGDDFSNISLSSWPMRPKVCCETSGCITVKLGV
ncbi:hypothetical protein V7S43_002792 [Phytophthora oleae]|uniref:Uncharacterized protein n=1 Tax=Phytophthora oleae TaxID=2107226 RepID=A0ABD3G2P9_9STRA